MSVSSPLANRQILLHVLIRAQRTVPVLLALLFIALSLPARSAQPAPSFPVGEITALPGLGNHSHLQWTTTLPENASPADYVFYLQQKQLPTGVYWDMPVQSQGEALSALPLDIYGSTFQLWAIETAPPMEAYLLDTTTVATYLPTAAVTIRSADPYSIVPRTRADQPFFVDINVQGIISDPDAPQSAKGVTLQMHTQSYGATGTGNPLNRELATLRSETEITANGTTTLSFPAHLIPSADPSKVRGEQRFTILSKEDYQAPPLIIDSQFVQVWPVASGSIGGFAPGQTIGASLPQISFQLTDLYPSSTTWAQVYKGAPKLNFTGTTIPGTSVVRNGTVPENRTITVANYGSVFDSDGVWTMELLTQTPFGTDRLAYVSFNVERNTPLEDWRQTHFGIPSNSGPGADEIDYDSDGIANIIEFAYGLDPKQGSAGQLPVPERIGDQLVIRFTPPAGVSGILHGVEWSNTLEPDSWLPLTNTGVAPEQVFSVPFSDKPPIFLRLRATAQ